MSGSHLLRQQQGGIRPGDVRDVRQRQIQVGCLRRQLVEESIALGNGGLDGRSLAPVERSEGTPGLNPQCSELFGQRIKPAGDAIEHELCLKIAGVRQLGARRRTWLVIRGADQAGGPERDGHHDREPPDPLQDPYDQMLHAPPARMVSIVAG